MVVTEYALERQGEQEVLHIFCHSEHEVAMCPRCGQFSDVLHEQEERCIRHLDIWGKAPPTCIFHPAVLTANIARNHSRKACPGWKASDEKARHMSCMCTSNASIWIRRLWRNGKGCTPKP